MLDLVVQSGQFWIQRFLSHLSCVAWCPLSAIPSACLQASSATCHIRGIRFRGGTRQRSWLCWLCWLFRLCFGCIGLGRLWLACWLAGWLAGWLACSVLVVLVVLRAHRPRAPLLLICLLPGLLAPWKCWHAAAQAGCAGCVGCASGASASGASGWLAGLLFGLLAGLLAPWKTFCFFCINVSGSVLGSSWGHLGTHDRDTMIQ